MQPAALSRLRPGDHVCGTFDDDRRQLEAVARYVREGLDQGHRVVYYTHTLLPHALTAGLEAYGVPVAAAASKGQLRVSSTAEGYLDRDGFDPIAVRRAWRAEQDAARAAGWFGLRAVGDMAWAVAPMPLAALTQYEAEINTLFAEGYAMGLCLYDRRLFTTAELAPIAAAHPATAGPAAADDWEPALRMRYTRVPAMLSLSGEVDLSNRRAMTAVIVGLRERIDGCEAVIDASALAVRDTASAVALVRAVDAAGGRLRLEGCSPLLTRLIRTVQTHSTERRQERVA